MKTALLGATILLILGGTALGADTQKRDLWDVVGCTHVAGKYNFTEQDFLNEGADKLFELGTRVIKLWFTPNCSGVYSFNSQWPEYKTLVELAKTPYYRKVFGKPFTTYILETFRPGHDWHYFRDGMPPETVEAERKELYEFAKYLLTEYKGTGKTFILQNWESDWVLTDPKFTKEPDPKVIERMIVWFNARQDGVEQARAEIGMHGVKVYHAAEVNLIGRAMEGKVTATNDVIPKTHCDLYSYSAWDTLRNPEKFRKALDYLKEKAPDSRAFGANNVYLREYGCPENEVESPEKHLQIVKAATETALDWGAPYVVYWELYCNEPKGQYEGRPTNKDCRGFWLIRPDGTKPPLYDYFAGLLRP